MNFITQNWVFLALIVAFVGVHLFGHGGCGGHSNHSPAHNNGTKSESSGSNTAVKQSHAGCH